MTFEALQSIMKEKGIPTTATVIIDPVIFSSEFDMNGAYYDYNTNKLYLCPGTTLSEIAMKEGMTYLFNKAYVSRISMYGVDNAAQQLAGVGAKIMLDGTIENIWGE